MASPELGVTSGRSSIGSSTAASPPAPWSSNALPAATPHITAEARKALRFLKELTGMRPRESYLDASDAGGRPEGRGGVGLDSGQSSHPLLPCHLPRLDRGDWLRELAERRDGTQGGPKPGNAELPFEAPVVTTEGDGTNPVGLAFLQKKPNAAR